jgi:parallel beta-helix repeat protein
MSRLLGLVLAAALTATLLLASQALANHVQCGDVITQDTTLDSDLDCTGNGLIVSGSDLTLDLGGHTIRGDGDVSGSDTGIHVAASRVTVENGQVEDFAFAAQIGSSAVPDESNDAVLRQLRVADSRIGVFGCCGNRPRIEDSRFVNNGSFGIYLGTTSHILIQRNTFDEGNDDPDDIILEQAGSGSVVRENQGGFLLVSNSDEDLTVEDNRFSGMEIGNGVGLRLVRNAGGSLFSWGPLTNAVIEQNRLPKGITVFSLDHSRVSQNHLGGIHLEGSSDNLIERNSISGGRIFLRDLSDRNLITRNSIVGSPNNGIELDADFQHYGSTGNVIERNFVSESGENGVLVESFSCCGGVAYGETDTVLRDNVIRGNALDGVAVQDGSTGTLLEGNRVLRNGDDGLDVKDASSSIFGNRAWFNGDLGIEAVAGVTGSGNWAKHNGNPAQCIPMYLCKHDAPAPRSPATSPTPRGRQLRGLRRGQ